MLFKSAFTKEIVKGPCSVCTVCREYEDPAGILAPRTSRVLVVAPAHSINPVSNNAMSIEAISVLSGRCPAVVAFLLMYPVYQRMLSVGNKVAIVVYYGKLI